MNKAISRLSYSVSGILFLIVFLVGGLSSEACTVFVLTNGKHTYFFNNEDFSNPKTRLWFIPKGQGYYGSAYVGYDDGEPQGGVNTQGLAFDWVTVDTDGYTVDPNYVPEKHLKHLDGNSSQWMLEQCKTIEEAIKFYQTYRETAFARTTLAIVDKSGASVIIGSKDGKIYFDTSHISRGLGYGEATFQKLYKAESDINVNVGAQILRQCMVSGDGGTKYSNSYDLNTGDIVFYNFANQNENTKINLTEELKKGSHYYEINQIAFQTRQSIRPLMLNMNRHILFINSSVADQEPLITGKIKNLFRDVATGKLKYDDLTEAFANDLKKVEDQIKSNYGRFGNLKSLELIHKERSQEFIDYNYVMKFEKVTILWQFLLNDENKIHDFNTLSVSWIR